MGISENRRQKKLAKKKQKRKEKRSALMPSLGSPLSLAKSVVEAGKYPLHECLVPRELFRNGIGTIVISRKLSHGEIAVGVFLLDVFCLGVKNAYFRVLSLADYRMSIDAIGLHETLTQIDPSCVRKLIEQCVDYAGDIGFEPHPDYKLAKNVFGDIEASACPERFEFGRGGKPLFIAGPNDGPKRCKEIISTLERSCGSGGFDFVVGMPGI